jgi:hypothetical protein
MRPTKTSITIDALAILRVVGRRRLIVALVGCCTVLPAAAAQAQSGPGVTVDPGSPSAKEYGIPLEDARRNADPSSSASRHVVQGSRRSPLFGEGVSSGGRQSPVASARGGSARRGSARRGGSADGSAGGEAASAQRRGSSAAAGGGSVAGSKSRRSPAAVVDAAARPGAPSGGSSTLLFVGIGALVLGLGALGGLWLRRRTGA